MIQTTQPVRHIKTAGTVTQIDVTSNPNMFGNPPRTVVTTTERATYHAGGPRQPAATLADHVAALRSIGCHTEAVKIEAGGNPEQVTGGYRSVIEGAY